MLQKTDDIVPWVSARTIFHLTPKIIAGDTAGMVTHFRLLQKYCLRKAGIGPRGEVPASLSRAQRLALTILPMLFVEFNAQIQREPDFDWQQFGAGGQVLAEAV